MTIKVYKYCDPGRHVLFFIRLGERWHYYTARWYNDKYPWHSQWRRITESEILGIDTTHMHVLSAGSELPLVPSNALEFLILTGTELHRSVEAYRSLYCVERQEAITKE